MTDAEREVERAEADYAKAKTELELLRLKRVEAIREKIETSQQITPDEERFLNLFTQDSILNALERIRQELASLNLRNNR